MINKFKLTALFLFVLNLANAQDPKVGVTASANRDNSVGFDFDKPDPGNYTLRLKLSDVTNSHSSSLDKTFNLQGYRGNFFSLSPKVKEQGIGYRYTYHYIRGKLNPKYDAGFIYLLPHKPGVKVQVAESGFLGAVYFGNTTPEDWKCYTFYTKKEDTVTAIRKGIVVEIKDEYETESNVDVSYTSKVNELTIEHADGTIASYRGLKKGTVPLKVGDTVFPGAVLGMNEKHRSGAYYSISILLMYLKSNDLDNARNQNLQSAKSLYGFVTPHFYTGDNADLVLTPKEEYTASVTPELIKKELSKKELKQLLK